MRRAAVVDTPRTTYEGVRDILSEALGVDKEEIVPEATLQRDLGAESIDFLDIIFRLEKGFNVRMGSISSVFPTAWGKLYDDDYCTGASTYSGGRLTDQGITKLQKDYPLLNLTGFDRSKTVDELHDRETVDYLARYIDAKLKDPTARFVYK